MGELRTEAAGPPPNAKTQESSILRLLIDARGQWVPLQRILDLRISQYGRAIHSLRHKLKFNIENRTETIDGVRRSWFRLLPSRPSHPEQPVEGTVQLADALEGRD